jgi:hypothetical protein
VEEICMMEIEEIDFVVLRFRQNFMEWTFTLLFVLNKNHVYLVVNLYQSWSDLFFAGDSFDFTTVLEVHVPRLRGGECLAGTRGSNRKLQHWPQQLVKLPLLHDMKYGLNWGRANMSKHWSIFLLSCNS